MKTMTCGQLGGPCEAPHHGTTADEVIKAQERHLQDLVAGGDSAHEGALQAMRGRRRNPVKGMGWYRQVKRDFAELPDD
jgi:predicted small metal-binding protein